jgi:hypothetical protein
VSGWKKTGVRHQAQGEGKKIHWVKKTGVTFQKFKGNG